MLRLGIAGMGYAGTIHYQAARAIPGIEVVGVFSSKGDQLRRRFPELEVIPSYERLLSDDRVDAVIVCVPTFLHEQYVIQAVKAGRHVMVEKPLALSVESAARIRDEVEHARVIAMVAQVVRFWPQYMELRRRVSEGWFGHIRAVRAYRLAQPPFWSEWFRDPEKSGGCLLDLQTHDVDFLYWTFGAPRQVQAWVATSSNGDWDHVHSILDYGDMIASLESSYLMPQSWPLTAGIRVVGSDAAFEYAFRSAGDMESRSTSKHTTVLYTKDVVIDEPVPQTYDVYGAQLLYFARCVRQKKVPANSSLQSSYEVMRIMAAIKDSSLQGKPIRIGKEAELALQE